MSLTFVLLSNLWIWEELEYFGTFAGSPDLSNYAVVFFCTDRKGAASTLAKNAETPQNAPFALIEKTALFD